MNSSFAKLMLIKSQDFNPKQIFLGVGSRNKQVLSGQ